MLIRDRIGCQDFPCQDVRHAGYIIPRVDINPQLVLLMMISEAAPTDKSDYYYQGGNSAFESTTLEVFKAAGVGVTEFDQLLPLGIYLTSAVKCGKTGYGVNAATINECSRLLEKEIALFPNLKVIMLMGDVAIKGINYIARRAGEGKVIPSGSTYKIRHGEFQYRGMRIFPSYLQAGPSFGIEKSKRRMIIEDIETALAILS